MDKKIIEKYVHRITDENENKWEVVETSDLDDIFAEAKAGQHETIVMQRKLQEWILEWSIKNVKYEWGTIDVANCIKAYLEEYND